MAAPVPSRARASYADIFDNGWELWRGGVRLASRAVQREYPDEDIPRATWPLLPQDSDAASALGLGLGLRLKGLGNEQSSIVERSQSEDMQGDCNSDAERLQDQNQEEEEEVVKLLDELLELQRCKCAQEKEESRLAHMLSVPFCGSQAFARVGSGLDDETMGNVRGRAGDFQCDATDSPYTSSSTHPFSFSTSSSTTISAMPPSVEDISAVGKSSSDSHGSATHSHPCRRPQPEASEIAPKNRTGMVSWGNRVGRRIRACGRRIIGKA